MATENAEDRGKVSHEGMYVLDTNILTYQAASNADISAFFDEHKDDIFYIPSIVVAEFLSYPLITESAISAFKDFVSQLIILNLDYRIAELAAELRRRSHVKLMDAIVAASALSANAILVTKNVRDFQKVPGLKLFSFS